MVILANPPCRTSASSEVCHASGTLSDELAAYVQRLFEPGDIIEMRRLPSRRRSWHLAGELHTIADDLRRANDKGQNIHVGANPRTRTGGSKAEDVQLARSIFADFDHTTVDEARDRWQRIGMDAPTLTVASGHGVHAYWRLEEPETDLSAWTQRQRELADALRSDPAVCDAPRMMRLPGYTNWKPPAADCRIIGTNDTRIGAWTPGEAPHAHPGGDTHLAAVCAVCAVNPEVETAILATLPRGPGQRNRAIFSFARHLRAVPALAGASVRELRPVVARWHEAALPTITTKSLDETWADFVTAWGRVRWVAGTDPITEVVARAKAASDPHPAALYDTPTARLLVGVCRELQAVAGDGPFFISCRQAGEAVGVSHVIAAQMLKMLVADGVLAITTPNTTKRATRYRYIGGVAK